MLLQQAGLPQPQSQPQAPTLDKAVAARSPSIGGSGSGGSGGGSGVSTLRRAAGPASATSSPEHSDHALSASSDSGLSNASLWTERGSVAAPKTPVQGQGQGEVQGQGPSQQEKAELKRLLSGFGLEEPPLFHGAMDGEPEDGVVIGGGGGVCVGSGVGGVGGVGVDIVSGHRVLHHTTQVQGVSIGGVPQTKERETDILDDEVLTMSGHDLRSVDSLGTLSSSCHKSSQNSLLSDGFGSPGGPEDMAHHHHHNQHHQQQHLQHQQHHHHQQQQHHLHLNHNNSHHIQHQHHHLPHQQHSIAGMAMDEYERAYGEAVRRGCLGPRSNSVPVSPLPPSLACADSGSRAGSFRQGSYSTHTWVQQQQMVAAQQYSYLPEDVVVPEDTSVADNYHHGGGVGGGSSSSPLSPEPAIAAAAVSASVTVANVEQGNGMDAVAAVSTEAPPPVPLASQTVVDKSCDEEFNSLTVDIDNSIDQLNQLIMDLDPTFVPIPTRTGSVKRNGGGNHANGPATACTNGTTHRVSGNSRAMVQPAAAAPGDVRPEGVRCLSRQASDVPDHPATQPWGLREEFAERATFPSSCSPHTQHGGIFRAESLDYRNQSVEQDSGVEAGSDMVPPTPAFPISPPTPYIKNMSEFLHLRQTPSPGMQMYGAYRTDHDSRVYSDIISHASEAGGLPDHSPSCHHPFASARSATLGGTLTRTESPLQSPWQEGPMLFRQASLPPQRSGPTATGTVDYSHHSPPGHHPAPKAHSSPRGSQRSRATRYASCRSPARSFDEQDGPSSADSFGGHTGELLSEGSPQHHQHHHQQHQQFHQPPLLPEKRRASDGEHSLGSASPALSGFSSPHSGSSLSIPFPNVLPEGQGRGTPGTSSPLPDVLASKQLTVKFVQDTSKFWYKPDIARDQAIAVLKDKEPGSFIVRDSHSFRGAYGLAMKVATPPPSVLQQSKKGGDLSNELVRHFLIECTQKGVRLKGCPNEPYFGSLTALVCQHSITPLALPCKLIIPDRDPLEDAVETTTHQSITNSATELLKQGAACNVWFLGSVEMESLTGYQAIQKATGEMLSLEPLPISTVVHFKVSSQGITLTDNQRKLFFRRHYAVTTVIFCALDPQDRKWKRDGCASARIFGFVARKSGSAMDNVCHLFAEHDPEQPASAIVNFVSKVMIGSQKNN